MITVNHYSAIIKSSKSPTGKNWRISSPFQRMQVSFNYKTKSNMPKSAKKALEMKHIVEELNKTL